MQAHQLKIAYNSINYDNYVANLVVIGYEPPPPPPQERSRVGSFFSSKKKWIFLGDIRIGTHQNVVLRHNYLNPISTKLTSFDNNE